MNCKFTSRFLILACLVIAITASDVVADERPIAASADKEKQKPNVLFILTDDQGWPTLSCYGNKLVKTPNLDRLAAGGTRFTDAYVMPQCTPTRAALLTGEHTARNRMWHVIGWYGSPWAPVHEPMFREHLAPESCRLPHAMRAAGYKTGMAGKWHLTNNEHGHYLYLKPESANAFGFDYVAGPGEGHPNDGDKWVDHLTDSACDFMERNRGEPWFFYLSHHTLHSKVSAPQPLVDKYLRQGAPAEGMYNATYLASIEHLDNSIGRLLATLDDLGIADNTMVVFLGDNGGVDTSYQLPEVSGDPLDGSVPLKVRFQAFDNAPLRAGKGSVYEGGIRVPCIVRWPGVAKVDAVCTEPIHVVDWLPTLLSAAGAKLKTATDGVNLKPALQGDELAPRSLYWYMPMYDLRWASSPAAIVRQGDYKLIHYFGDRWDADGNYHLGAATELYNLRNDLGETKDLSITDTKRTRRMRRELFDWIESTGAPTPHMNRHADKTQYFRETKEKQPWNK